MATATLDLKRAYDDAVAGEPDGVVVAPVASRCDFNFRLVRGCIRFARGRYHGRTTIPLNKKHQKVEGEGWVKRCQGNRHAHTCSTLSFIHLILS